MPTQTERRALIAKIRSLPKDAQAAVKGLSDEQLRTPYREGGWTVAQVIHHLADSHMNAYVRMRLAMTEEHPTIKAYDQDAWASLADAGSTQLGPSLAILRGLHRRWVAFLRAIPAKAWGRAALHPRARRHDARRFPRALRRARREARRADPGTAPPHGLVRAARARATRIDA